MKLDEAINLLKESNYLVEFVQTSVPLDVLIRLLKKEFGIQFTDVTTAKRSFIVLKGDEKLTLQKARQIAGFIKKYGYILDNYALEHINIEPIHKNHFKNSDFGCYVHQSYAPPQIVFKTGLRCKSKFGRLYLFGYKTKEDALAQYDDFIKSWPKEVDASSGDYENVYGNKAYLQKFKDREAEGGFYTYIVEVPENCTIHKDLEYGEFDDIEGTACYVESPIPPENIKAYLGSELL